MKKLIDLFNIPYSLNMGLSGMTDESFCLYTYGMFQKNNKGILIITSTLTEANNLLNIFLYKLNLDYKALQKLL